MAQPATKLNRAYAALLAGATSLGVFWIVNVCKEAYSNVKGVLNLYSPVGPLLGLFLLSLAVFAIVYVIFLVILRKPLGETVQKAITTIYIVSAVLFFFMVFPPISELIINFLSPS